MKKYVFLINQAKGLVKSLKKEHPKLKEEVLKKFVRDMNTETYVYTYQITNDGIKVGHLYKNKQEIEKNRQETQLRNILGKCETYATGGELPSAVIYCKEY